MKRDWATEFKLSELILLKISGDIRPEQADRLRKWLQEDPEAVEYYVEYMMQYAGLTQPGDISIADLPEEKTSPVLETSLWLALSEFEKKAEAVEVERPPAESRPATDPPARPRQTRTQVSRFSLYTLLLSSAAMLFLIVYARFAPSVRGMEVATVSDALNARWGQAERTLREGTRLATKSDPLWLREGLVTLSFDNGSRVVLEGPAQFEILTGDQIHLNYGRLYAAVPTQAIGFIVSTANSKIIDLGTEFGVKAGVDGQTEVHVMRGRTMLISGAGKHSKTQHELQQGQARAVTTAGTVEDISLRNEAFVRRIDSQTALVWKGQKAIDLADIVGGGNGLGTGQINMGINYSGQTEMLETFTSEQGPTDYIPVPDNPFIDGVFIPNGPSQVSSGGIVYDGFEATNGRYWLGVLNGAWHQIERTVKVPRHQLRLDGKEYGTPNNPAIYLSSNQGITFDLDAVRSHTKMELTRFTALCGLSESYRQYWEIMKDYPYFREVPNASFYVLIDGQVRFAQRDMASTDPAMRIAVDLAAGDRYLTLATTEGSDKTNNGDWTLFARPVLEIQE